MKKHLFLTTFVALLLLASSIGALAQKNANSNSSGSATAANANANSKRGPVFRATKDQIMQAQAILKQRGFYAGEQTGKLDPETREGLKKYQTAERLKVTGTLNKATLEKMNIPLTDKQKAM